MERRVRDPRRGAAPGLGELVDPLVVLEHPDEQRDRPLGQRDRRDQERVEVGKGRKDAVGLDAELPDEAGGIGRDRAHAVGPPDRLRGDDVGDRPEQPPCG
jgi:hypothetical protein